MSGLSEGEWEFMQNNMSRIVSFIVLLASIVVIGALFYKVMIGFLVPIFLAAVLVVVFRPLHRWVMAQVGEREHLAAAITTCIILFLVLLPAGVIATTAAVQGASLVKNFDENNIDVTLERVRTYLKLELPYKDQIQSIQNEVEELRAEVLEGDTTRLYDPNQKLASLVKRLKEEGQTLKTLVMAAEAAKSSKASSDHTESGVTSSQAPSDQRDPKAPSQDETEINADADKDKSFAFDKEFDDFETSLKKIDPKQFDKGSEPDVIEIQQNSVRFGNQWQILKEKILGGSIQATLRDLANPTKEEIKALRAGITEYIRPRLFELTSMTGVVIARMVIGGAILSLSLFFFLYDGPAMMRAVMQLSPLDDRYERELLSEFDRTARAVVLATILSAVVQGLIAGLGYYAVGMPSLILLILLTTMCALVPFVGPALVWVPVCLYLLIYRESTISAGGLAIWGVLVVGTSDNFVKAFVLHGQRQLHPLLALLSVLGGVQSLGPIGIIVGPMAVTMLQTLLGILQHELTNFDVKSPDGPFGNDKIRKRMAKKSRKKSDEPGPTTAGDVVATDAPSDGPPQPTAD